MYSKQIIITGHVTHLVTNLVLEFKENTGKAGEGVHRHV